MAGISQKLKSEKYNSVFLSIEALPVQFLSALNSKISLPANFKKINNVVLAGMGGSALGAHVVEVLDISRVPFSFYNDYKPPIFVNKNTLFIASSYSGNTEEVLFSLTEAEKRGAKIVIITAGGRLEKMARLKKYPFIKFDSKYNPSAQPRYGAGYALGALFNILTNCGVSNLSKKEIREVIKNLKSVNITKASKLAKELKGIAPVFIASGFLEGNAHIITNQVNETCKTNAFFYSIPELNHHLMEGLKRPESNKKYLKFIFLESSFYTNKIKLRYKITKEVIRKNNIKLLSLNIEGKSRLEQVLNFLALGSLASLILAIEYNEDPIAIPFVNYFKSKLK